MLIDTHAHIYLDQFAEDLDEMINRAEDENIRMILMPNIDKETIGAMLEVEKNHPQCRSMIGLHPCSVKEDYQEQLSIVEEELNKGGYIAVGEIGTDLYWDKTYWEQQKEAFNRQLELAEKFNLPVVIHCRETLDETIDLVTQFPGSITGVFHCFTGNLEQFNRIKDLGFYVGIGGVSTYKNSGMDEVLKEMDLSNVILETDSPYLSPVPVRGKRNEPANIYHIALNLAQKRGQTFKEIEKVTTDNAMVLFGLE